jgi:rhomboid protease GluP
MAITIDALKLRFATLEPTFAPPENDILLEPPATMKDNINGFVALFNPVKGYSISPILLTTNLIIYLTMVFLGVDFMNPDVESLLLWGANYRPLTVGGEWWRLVTSTFIHIGLIHILLNMYALVLIGLFLEPYLGKVRFVSAYILTGILASLCSLWWNENTVSAGASGAIFGMYGVFLAMLSTNLIEKEQRKNLLTSIGIFVAYNLFAGLKAGIDNAAHIGGLLSGLLIGYGYYPGLKSIGKPVWKYAPIGAAGIVAVGLCIFVFGNLSSSGIANMDDLIRYEERIEKFYIQESMALEIYNMPENASERELLSEIRNRGIYYWKENIKILDEVEGLELSDDIRDRNKVLRKYCELRLELYGLFYAGIDENTNKYESRIVQIDHEIMTLLESLGITAD